MSEAKPTNGPWVFAYGSVYTSDESSRIAMMDKDNPKTMPTERDANARLIAAAPDLLWACERALDWLDATSDFIGKPFGEEVSRTLKAAISKAKGQP